MTEITDRIERYVASWNDPDPSARRAVIGDVWADEGVYRNASTEFTGRSGVEQAVAEAHDAFVARGFVFAVAGVDTNHDAVRYRWELSPAAGGPPDSVGTHVATVGADGRLVSDYQFIDVAPSAAG